WQQCIWIPAWTKRAALIPGRRLSDVDIPFLECGSVLLTDADAPRPSNAVEAHAYVCNWLLCLDDDLERCKLVTRSFERHGSGRAIPNSIGCAEIIRRIVLVNVGPRFENPAVNWVNANTIAYRPQANSASLRDHIETEQH